MRGPGDAPPRPRVSGSRVALVTATDPRRLSGGDLYVRGMVQALRQAGILVAPVVLPVGPSPAPAAGLRRALLRLQPSLVIVDSVAMAAAVPILPWIWRELGARVVALVLMKPSELVPRSRKPAVRRLEVRLLRAAGAVVAISPDLRDWLVEAGAPPGRVFLIPPGRDQLPFQGAARRAPDRESFRFLCVANWSPAKGIHLAVAAMARLGDGVELDLVGHEGDARYLRRVRMAIRRHDLADRVRVHGALRGEPLAARYAAADAFVLPSRSEGFGIAYAEAMGAGLPVVACRMGPLPWLVEEGCGLLVPPGDPAALAGAMATLAADPVLARRMGETARLRAVRLPTWQESEEAFCGLVRRVLSAECQEPIQ